MIILDKEPKVFNKILYVLFPIIKIMTDNSYLLASRLFGNSIIWVPSLLKCAFRQMVYIGTTQNRAENVFRLVEVTDTKGNNLPLITNRFDLEAESIIFIDSAGQS